MPHVPQTVDVKRSDPVYMAHAYLTKVPLQAIEPFLEAFTEPGDCVLDPFAGSGMTGVAAAISGRRAILYDISVLGRHIGTNYINLVEAEDFRKVADQVIRAAVSRIGDVYATTCLACGEPAELSRSVMSVVLECPGCRTGVTYYHALRAADWHKSKVACTHCRSALKNAPRVGEARVQDVVRCHCERKLREQLPAKPPLVPRVDGLSWPDVPIDESRQMFHASALGKHNLRSTASFFSGRNIAALAALRAEIGKVDDERLRGKLLFAFTGILARASKRYQWHPKRPLNAANQNYYIAPVFYEWNVYDLFLRKAEAIVKSDDFIRRRLSGEPEVEYRIGSAHQLDLADGSVDYVFTDPPFGSNIFYSDMNLFQEAWLDRLTDAGSEAVVDRSVRGGVPLRTAQRYEQLLTGALQECARVLKDDGWLTLVFSNNSGALWALVQRAVRNAGFVIEPEAISVLNKGQRSVKGLASGFENVVTLDLMLSMRKARGGDPPALVVPGAEEASQAVHAILVGIIADTPSHVYVELIRHGMRNHWDLSAIDFSAVTKALEDMGFEVEPATGKLTRSPGSVPQVEG